MTVGGDRQLDAPLFGELSVARNDGRHQLGQQTDQYTAIGQAVVAALLDQLPSTGVGAPHGLTQPGQVIPHQQVDQKLIREVGQTRRMFQHPIRQARQTPVGRETINHLRAIDAQGSLDQHQALPGLRGQDGTRQGLQQGIMQAVLAAHGGLQLRRVVGDLFQQGGREIDHRPGQRLGFQMGRHVDIVLDAVQVGPGRFVVMLDGIFVTGLMHVPIQHDGKRRLIGHKAVPAAAFPA